MSKLGKMLGKGSDGEVYEILDDDDNVVKYIQPKICGIENYLEYYIMLYIKHPNIVGAREIELTEHNLVKIVQKKAISNLCIKLKNKRLLFSQIVQGIKFLNDHNIIHGDIKPSNILIFENQVVKLNDLALCRYIDSQSTRQLYTYHYRPPEIDKNKPSINSDVFALGCTLFELYFNESYYDKKFQNKIHLPKSGTSKDRDFLDLIYNMTQEDVNNRYSINDVCNHKYFKKFKFKSYKCSNFDNYMKLEMLCEKKGINETFIKKCMNEVLHTCMSFNDIDRYVASVMKFKIFDYCFKNEI